jgi:hypothetical protein
MSKNFPHMLVRCTSRRARYAVPAGRESSSDSTISDFIARHAGEITTHVSAAALADCDAPGDARALFDARNASRPARQRAVVMPVPRAHVKRVQNLLYFRRISQRRGISTKNEPAIDSYFFTQRFIGRCIADAPSLKSA